MYLGMFGKLVLCSKYLVQIMEMDMAPDVNRRG